MEVELTIEQKRAVAMANARMRIQNLKKEGDRPQEKPIVMASGADEIAGNPITRFALGAASPAIGLFQLGANAVGAGEPVNEHLKSLNEAKKRGMEARGDGSVDLMGGVGAVLSPVSLAAMKVPMPKSNFGAAGQGAAMGAGFGAATPVEEGNDYWGNKGVQAVTGALLGGVVPPAVSAGGAVARGVSNVVDPYLPGGASRGAARLGNLAAGDKADQVIAALQNSRAIVPGSNPTAGQASVPANSAEFAALQRLAAERKPSIYAGPQGIEGQQEAARASHLRFGLAEDKPHLMAAEHNRLVRADPMYAQARNAGNVVDSAPIIERVDKIISQNPGNRELIHELTNVRNGLIDEAGNPRTNARQVASVMDGLKAARAKEENKFIGGILDRIGDDISRSIPGYSAAQQEFARMSVPINQMQVGQALMNKLSAPMGVSERPNVFAQAMRDEAGTLKRSTGFPHDELDQVLTPSQMGKVNSVMSDLQRDAVADALASRGMPAARDAIGKAEPIIPPTGMFSPILSVARGTYNRVSGKATDKILDQAAIDMQNPQAFGEAMQAAKERMRRMAVIEAMAQRGAVPASVLGAEFAEQ